MMCPTCKRKFPQLDAKERPLSSPLARPPSFPFCSERCRLADLGAWLDGAHRIAAPLGSDELDQLAASDPDRDERWNKH